MKALRAVEDWRQIEAIAKRLSAASVNLAKDRANRFNRYPVHHHFRWLIKK